MSLRPAELKCYLVVIRAIQRDINGGELSIRQIAERANLSPQHAHRAIAAVVDRGLLLRQPPDSASTRCTGTDPERRFQPAKLSARLVSYLTNDDSLQRRCSDLLV